MKYFCCKRQILTRTILGLGMRLRSPSRVSGHRGECCRMLAGGPQLCWLQHSCPRPVPGPPRPPAAAALQREHGQYITRHMQPLQPAADHPSPCCRCWWLQGPDAAAGHWPCPQCAVVRPPGAWRHDMLTADEIALTHANVQKQILSTSTADP